MYLKIKNYCIKTYIEICVNKKVCDNVCNVI